MKTLSIEGFTVETNLDEQDVFCRMYKEEEGDDINDEIEMALNGGTLIDFIEEVAVGGLPVAEYFYANRMGYKDRRLEPFTWRANKRSIVMSYTGAMGGGEWYAKVFL